MIEINNFVMRPIRRNSMPGKRIDVAVLNQRQRLIPTGPIAVEQLRHDFMKDRSSTLTSLTLCIGALSGAVHPNPIALRMSRREIWAPPIFSLDVSLSDAPFRFAADAATQNLAASRNLTADQKRINRTQFAS
jgi:hypothetical protein